jgi:hypothetical protein
MSTNINTPQFLEHNDWRIKEYNSIVGYYLNYVSVLENSIINSLMLAYCGEHSKSRMLFTRTLSSKLSLSRKVETYLSIMKDLKILNKEERGDLQKHLKIIVKRRNLLAHSILLNTDEEILRYEKHRFKIIDSDIGEEIMFELEEHKPKVELLHNIIEYTRFIRTEFSHR